MIIAKDIKVNIGTKDIVIDIKVNKDGNLEFIGLPCIGYEFYGDELVMWDAEEYNKSQIDHVFEEAQSQ